MTERITSEWLREDKGISDLIAEQMSRAAADMAWEFQDEFENAHLGPRYGPGRGELREACARLRQLEYFRSLGRPAGPYRN